MKFWKILCAVLFMAGCSKKDNPPKNSILTSHKWYAYSERTVFSIDSSNTIETDTTIFYSYPGCLPNYIHLNADSSASLEVNCMTLNLLPGSYWKLWPDSSFLVYIPVSRVSYGTGYIVGNAGILWSKLQNISDTEFTTRITDYRWVIPPNVKYRQDRYLTYRAR